MTDAADTAKIAAGPRPQLLTLAGILLIATAVLAVIAPLTFFTDQTYVGCRVAVANANATPTATASSSASPSASPSTATNEQLQQQFDDCVGGQGSISPASGSEVSDQLVPSLVQGAIPLILLGGIAFFVFRGTPLTRWLVVGIWVISNLVPLTPFGLLNITGIFSASLPPLTVVVYVLGILALTVAAVLMNLKPVTTYLNARRPVRTAVRTGGTAGQGGVFGGLFGTRSARNSTGSTGSGSTGSGSTGSAGVSMTKPVDGTTPASTRPPKSKGGSSGGSGNTGRSKGKRRG